MAGDVLILDAVVFGDFSTPNRITGGMAQMLGVQKLIGGDRVIDAMGPDPEALKWSGRWRGPGALANSQTLDALTAAGGRYSLTWGSNFFQVVIERYVSNYEASFEIPYDISCIVVPDGSNVTAAPTSLDALVGQDLNVANNPGTAGAPSASIPANSSGPSLSGGIGWQ